MSSRVELELDTTGPESLRLGGVSHLLLGRVPGEPGPSERDAAFAPNVHALKAAVRASDDHHLVDYGFSFHCHYSFPFGRSGVGAAESIITTLETEVAAKQADTSSVAFGDIRDHLDEDVEFADIGKVESSVLKAGLDGFDVCM